MKLRYAALFGAIASLVALGYTLWITSAGLDVFGDFPARRTWLLEHRQAWDGGLWLWLPAIFGWMLLHVTLIWSYLPAHRIATMLQSGLLILAAGLGIGGVVVWMSVLPAAMTLTNAAELVRLTDMLALGFFGAALLMGGVVTAWQAFDLAKLGFMPIAWVVPLALAGLALVPSPLLLPGGRHIIAATIVWAGWCLFMTTRRALPSAFTEWR